MIYYLAKMSIEELDLMLCRQVHANKREAYRHLIIKGCRRQTGYEPRILMMGAIILKRMDVIEQMISDITFHFQAMFLNSVCQYGDHQLIEFALKKYRYGPGALRWAICYAAKGGKQDIIDYLMNELGVGIDELCLPYAAFEGHLDVVKFFAERDASNIKSAIMNAYKSPNKLTKAAIIEYLENFERSRQVNNQ